MLTLYGRALQIFDSEQLCIYPKVKLVNTGDQLAEKQNTVISKAIYETEHP